MGLGFPSPRSITKIPFDIWKMIIDCACAVPRALDTSSTSPFEHSEVEYSYERFRKNLHASHDAQMRIRLVSRFFHDLVHDLCFKFLIMRDVEAGIVLPFKWWELASAFKYDMEYEAEEEENEVEEEENEEGVILGPRRRRRHNCWYVKRLEIIMQSDAEITEVDKIEAMGLILSCCPNVQMLSLNIPAIPGASGIPYPVFTALFPSTTVNCIHLRRLNWNSDINSATNLLFTYLPTLVNLEIFHITFQRRYHSIPSAKSITLRALHTLEVISIYADPSYFLCVAETWNMEAFRQFRLTSSLATAADAPNSFPFYVTHGPKLNTLDFTYLGSRIGPHILSHCTALKDMVIDVGWASPHIVKLQSKTVERIGIRGTQFKNLIRFSQDVYHLFAWFDALLNPFVLASQVDQLPGSSTETAYPEGWDGQQLTPEALKARRILYSPQTPLRPCRFPALHTIRLLEFYPALFQDRKWLSGHITMWGFWEQRLERMNIRFEDHDGKPIKLHVSKIDMWLNGDPPSWRYGYVYR